MESTWQYGDGRMVVSHQAWLWSKTVRMCSVALHRWRQSQTGHTMVINWSIAFRPHFAFVTSSFFVCASTRYDLHRTIYGPTTNRRQCRWIWTRSAQHKICRIQKSNILACAWQLGRQRTLSTVHGSIAITWSEWHSIWANRKSIAIHWINPQESKCDLCICFCFVWQTYPDEDHSLWGVRRHLYHSLDKYFAKCLVNAAATKWWTLLTSKFFKKSIRRFKILYINWGDLLPFATPTVELFLFFFFEEKTHEKTCKFHIVLIRLMRMGKEVLSLVVL